MGFTVKDWQDAPSGATPMDAAALEDLESRIEAAVTGPMVLTDATADPNTIKVDANANKSASTSVGGAILVENTGSTGAGVVVFTNRGADAAGRLMVLRSANAAFTQAALHIDYLGTNHAATIAHGGTGTASLALSVVSTNEDDTAVGVTGEPSARGTIKVTHNKPSVADGNASALSILLNGAGTACQGIFLDTEAGVSTTGKLINFRQAGAERFVVHPDGSVQIGAGPMWVYGTGSPEGAVAAPVGSLYSRTDGGAGTSLYVKESGTGTTGWVAK